MGAKPGEYRELPGPVAEEMFKDLEGCSVTTVQNNLIFLDAHDFRGMVVKDVDGHQYLDFFSGAGVSNLGHHRTEVCEEVDKQLHGGAWQYDESVFPNPLSLELRKKLADLTPGTHRKKVFLCNSGTEAVEAALKIAFAKRPDRKRVIAFKGAFHGRTGYSLALHGSQGVHKRQYPTAYPVHYYPFPAYVGMLGRLLNDAGTVFDVRDVNAVILELIQGEGGINVASRSEVQKLSRWCKDNDILLIVDEVQTGIGRTGTLFVSEQYGIVPDIITIAKALSFGVAPAGATVVRADLDFEEKGRHANTNGGNMIACAAALAGLGVLERNPGILENANMAGEYLHKVLCNLASEIKTTDSKVILSFPRGMGLMRGIDIGHTPYINNPEERYQVSSELRDKAVDEAFRRGLIIEGAGNNAVRFTPPLTVSREDVDLAVRIFKEVILEIGRT